MLKIEYIWRELLYQAIEKNNSQFTLTALSHKFKLSTSVVSFALAPLRELAMVKIGKINSRIINCEKLLYYWATRRNLNKEIIYQTNSQLGIFEIEASMPQDTFPTAYSAYHLYFDDMPADYDNVYYYANNIAEIEKRFPASKNNANLFILKADQYLSSYEKTPLAQIFADLWNLPQWYAKEFSDELLLKIHERLGI